MDATNSEMRPAADLISSTIRSELIPVPNHASASGRAASGTLWATSARSSTLRLASLKVAATSHGSATP